MEIVCTLTINIITFIIMVLAVSNYADFTLAAQIILLLGLLVFLLIRFHRKVISKGVILVFFLCSAAELLFAIYMGSWRNSLGAFLFFVNDIVFLALLILISIFKYLLQRNH